MRGGYSIVTESFGRAPIETFVALDACRGDGRDAHFLYRHDIDIPLDAGLTTAFAAEVDRVRDLATRPGTVSAIVGLDARNWKFVRILLAEEGPGDDERGDGYPILWLSQPLPYTEASGSYPSSLSQAGVSREPSITRRTSTISRRK